VGPDDGPKEFKYRKNDGSEGVFDATIEACEAFGLFHGMSVRSVMFPEWGRGQVIGVACGHLWVHFEGDVGATYRRDGWRFAEIVMDRKGGRTSKPSPLRDVGEIRVGDRVRRGLDWQWNQQDGYSGNLGTVVEGSGLNLWVTVQWDRGARNTYRYASHVVGGVD
jgi:hypothetical protein